MQTMQHAIPVHTAIGECLLNSLFNEGSRIVLVELQDTDKLLHPSSFRPFLLEDCKHAVVGCRPIFAPAFHGSSVIKGSRPVLKQGEVMKRVKNILLSFVAAG